MQTSKKKKKRVILILNIGDTVKLSKGRIGLVRFVGKTQFGLGEWIGIELYNELIRTRHNGAVLGKRYFRCPAHRGIFIRRQLIKENIPVKQINPSIKNLRKKEKMLKDKNKKLLKKQKNTKKQKNVNKREAKLLKERKKYPNLSDEEFKKKMGTKYNNKNTKVSKNKPKETLEEIKEAPKEILEETKENSNQKQISKKEKEKQNVDNDIDVNYDWGAMQKKTEKKKLKSEFSSFSATIDKKIQDKNAEKKIRDEWIVGTKVEIYSYSNETWCIGEIIDIKIETKEWIGIEFLETKYKELERYSDDIRPLARAEVKIDDTDGVLESDDSLNDSEQDEEEEFTKELEKDFEQNFANHLNVIDEYEHQIDHFEAARKNLAKKLLQQRKKNIDEQQQLSGRAMHSAGSRRASTFVDSKSMADALFFDGDEEINEDLNELYVDTMSSDSYDSLNDTEEDESEEESKSECNEDEKQIRNLWKVLSKVEIYSYSYEQWFLGEIIQIKVGCEAEDDGEEWLEVKYLESKFKEIQRYSQDIRPIQLKKQTKNILARTKTKIILGDGDIEQDSLSEEEEELLHVVKDKRDIKIVTFFVGFSKFLTYIANKNGNGISVYKVNKSKYGKSLYVETGIESGWLITKIDDKDISQMILLDIEKILETINENTSNEYTITFEKNGDKIHTGINLKPSVYRRSKKNLLSDT